MLARPRSVEAGDAGGSSYDNEFGRRRRRIEATVVMTTSARNAMAV